MYNITVNTTWFLHPSITTLCDYVARTPGPKQFYSNTPFSPHRTPKHAYTTNGAEHLYNNIRVYIIL